MYKLKELYRVEETKHLVPNLSILTKALFGDNAYLVDWQQSHGDWATDKLKRGDGMVWLPWLAQLWLMEVEWKEQSNFFDQSRAFAKGKIDSKKLFYKLKEYVNGFERIFNEATPNLKEGYVVENIINKTIENHVKDDYLLPHCWVILGHEGDNIEKLKNDYERELQDRFKGDQQYILSMARMFQNDLSSYILLEQYCSSKCNEIIKIEPSILTPAVSNISSIDIPIREKITNDIPKKQLSINHFIPEISEVSLTGRADQIWTYLKSVNSELKPEYVKLRIQIDEKHIHDFKVDWAHSGYELMVFSKQGIRQKPGKAAREFFGELLPKKRMDIPYKFGVFIDVSQSLTKKIAHYKDAAHHVWLQKNEPDVSWSISRSIDREDGTYFSSINATKQRRIIDNILNRKELWKTFLEKRKMTSGQFKLLSEFKPKAISGFMRFLTENGIASRYGDFFKLNEKVIHEIQKLLSEKTNY